MFRNFAVTVTQRGCLATDQALASRWDVTLESEALNFEDPLLKKKTITDKLNFDKTCFKDTTGASSIAISLPVGVEIIIFITPCK